MSSALPLAPEAGMSPKLRVTPPEAVPSYFLFHAPRGKGDRVPGVHLFAAYCPQCISLNPSCLLDQGWVRTNELFIKLEGACRLIILLSVLYLILFILLATSGVGVLLWFFSPPFFGFRQSNWYTLSDKVSYLSAAPL